MFTLLPPLAHRTLIVAAAALAVSFTLGCARPPKAPAVPALSDVPVLPGTETLKGYTDVSIPTKAGGPAARAEAARESATAGMPAGKVAGGPRESLPISPANPNPEQRSPLPEKYTNPQEPSKPVLTLPALEMK